MTIGKMMAIKLLGKFEGTVIESGPLYFVVHGRQAQAYATTMTAPKYLRGAHAKPTRSR